MSRNFNFMRGILALLQLFALIGFVQSAKASNVLQSGCEFQSVMEDGSSIMSHYWPVTSVSELDSAMPGLHAVGSADWPGVDTKDLGIRSIFRNGGRVMFNQADYPYGYAINGTIIEGTGNCSGYKMAVWHTDTLVDLSGGIDGDTVFGWPGMSGVNAIYSAHNHVSIGYCGGDSLNNPFSHFAMYRQGCWWFHPAWVETTDNTSSPEPVAMPIQINTIGDLPFVVDQREDVPTANVTNNAHDLSVQQIVWHQTATPWPDPDNTDGVYVAGAFIRNRGWDRPGYHVIIGRQSAGGGYATAYWIAPTDSMTWGVGPGVNDISLHISYIDDPVGAAPTSEQLQTMFAITAVWLKEFNLTASVVFAHREVGTHGDPAGVDMDAVRQTLADGFDLGQVATTNTGQDAQVGGGQASVEQTINVIGVWRPIVQPVFDSTIKYYDESSAESAESQTEGGAQQSNNLFYRFASVIPVAQQFKLPVAIVIIILLAVVVLYVVGSWLAEMLFPQNKYPF